MKRIILFVTTLIVITIAGFAQSQKLNRTHTKKKATDTATVVLPTIQIPRDANSTGVTGIDGSINTPENSGRNRSSSIDTGR